MKHVSLVMAQSGSGNSATHGLIVSQEVCEDHFVHQPRQLRVVYRHVRDDRLRELPRVQ